MLAVGPQLTYPIDGDCVFCLNVRLACHSLGINKDPGGVAQFNANVAAGTAIAGMFSNAACIKSPVMFMFNEGSGCFR
jgi:hypothetical protein